MYIIWKSYVKQLQKGICNTLSSIYLTFMASKLNNNLFGVSRTMQKLLIHSYWLLNVTSTQLITLPATPPVEITTCSKQFEDLRWRFTSWIANEFIMCICMLMILRWLQISLNFIVPCIWLLASLPSVSGLSS